MKIKTAVTVLLISSVLSACSNTAVKNTGGSKKTARDVMASLNAKKTEAFRRGPHSMKSPAVHSRSASYTRTEKKELHGLFPRLPNPDICMYVDPHLSSENATIPGYTSCFSMYDKNHYALPGEMMATWQHKQ